MSNFELQIKTKANHAVINDLSNSRSERWRLDLNIEENPFYGYGYGTKFFHSPNFSDATGLDYFNVLGVNGSFVGYGIDSGQQTNVIDSSSKPSIPSSGDINVPNDYVTIQEAIDNATVGQTILVSEGTYDESLDFGGKNITLTSTSITDWSVIERTIIRSQSPVSATITFNGAETTGCIIQGFSIIDGMPAINGNSTNAIVRNNIIKNNRSIVGAEVGVIDRCANVIGNKIFNNVAQSSIVSQKTIINIIPNCTISNNIIYNNIGTGIAGGISSFGPVPVGYVQIWSNTIYNNSISGIANYYTGYVPPSVVGAVTNNIIWRNKTSQIEGLGSTDISDNCIQNYTGLGTVITDDPQFIDPLNGNFKLKASSPCIDSGLAIAIDYDIEWRQRPIGINFDIGAYEYYSFSTGWGYEYAPAVVANNEQSVLVTASVFENDVPKSGIRVIFIGSPGVRLENNTITTNVDGIATVLAYVDPEELHSNMFVGYGDGHIVNLQPSGIVTIKAIIDESPLEDNESFRIAAKGNQLFLAESTLTLDISVRSNQHYAYSYGYWI